VYIFNQIGLSKPPWTMSNDKIEISSHSISVKISGGLISEARNSFFSVKCFFEFNNRLLYLSPESQSLTQSVSLMPWDYSLKSDGILFV
jgi:hypothetical protein